MAGNSRTESFVPIRGSSLEHRRAQAIANQFENLFRDACVKIEVAGSVRRRTDYVRDLDFVCIQKGTLLDEMIAIGVAAEWLSFRDKSGPRFKQLRFRGFPLDLWIVLPDRSWGHRYLLSTGPVEANKLLVTQQYKGGILPDHLSFRDGHLWHRDVTRVATPTEEAIFNAAGLPFIPPQHRSNATYKRLQSDKLVLWEAETGWEATEQEQLL